MFSGNQAIVWGSPGSHLEDCNTHTKHVLALTSPFPLDNVGVQQGLKRAFGYPGQLAAKGCGVLMCLA
jgi:hypothetical protein